MAQENSIAADPASSLKEQSRIISFEGCEIWLCEEKVVVDSRVPLPDFTVREFARPRIYFESACYYVSEKSSSSSAPVVHRYVLTPWPKNDEAITREIVLNEQYLLERADERRRRRREDLAMKALVIFYPFLGFLWSPQKRVLNRIGFESHEMSGYSIYAGFAIGFLCGVFLAILALGAGTFQVSLLAGMVVFMVDAAIRFHRRLAAKDSIPPGFYEWLARRKDRYE